MLSFLVRETRLGFSCRSPRNYIGSPRSFAHLSISFPLLRRPSMAIIPLWVACWGKAFNKLFMIIVVKCDFSVAADIGSPRSFLFLSNCTPGILMSVASLPRAYWSREWYVRRHPCNKAHHWSRFCCDSFFSWILLMSFCHCFRANCRTEMPYIEQAQQMFPIRHVWNFLWLGYRQVGFWCRCTWFGFLGPSWFDRTTNGNMSHCGTPSLNDHLDHCFVVLKHIQQSFLMRKMDVWGNTINVIQHVGYSLKSLILVIDNGSPRSFRSLNRVSKDRTIRSQKSRAGIPSNLNPASKEMISDSVELCETEVCFLHIQLVGTNVWLPKMHNVPPEMDFESSRSPAKSESWNSPSLHCFCSISHIAILFVFTCVMNVWNQTTFVTGFGPFCDRSCKFIHWPKNIRSSNSCQVETF